MTRQQFATDKMNEYTARLAEVESLIEMHEADLESGFAGPAQEMQLRQLRLEYKHLNIAIARTEESYL